MNSEHIKTESIDWESIRTFIVRRKWIARLYITDDLFKDILSRKFDGLNDAARYDLSLFITGYRAAKR